MIIIRYIILLVFVLSTHYSFGNTIENSIWVVGHILNEQSVEIEDGVKSSQINLLMSHSFGILRPGFDFREILIHFPTNLQKDFYDGEKVLIFLTISEGRYWAAENSTWSIVKLADQERAFQVNTNQSIALDDLYKQTTNSKIEKIKKPFENTVTRSRGPASYIAATPKKSEMSVYWLIVIFSLLGAFRSRIKIF